MARSAQFLVSLHQTAETAASARARRPDSVFARRRADPVQSVNELCIVPIRLVLRGLKAFKNSQRGPAQESPQARHRTNSYSAAVP